MPRIAAFAYGLVVYALFLGVFLYLAAFLGNVPLAPKTIDTDPQPFTWTALLINVGLLGLFALQHAVMARPAFKRRWTRICPPVIERSTFVLATCAVLSLLFWQWRAIEGTLWSFDGIAGGVLTGTFWLGVLIVFVSTWNIGHFHLFGLRQVWDNLRGKPQAQPFFHTPGLYKHVRHPIMTGFLIAMWCVPTMTVGHLVFSAVASAYIFIAVKFLEERDLRDLFGARYDEYIRTTGAYLPLPGGNREPARAQAN